MEQKVREESRLFALSATDAAVHIAAFIPANKHVKFVSLAK